MGRNVILNDAQQDVPTRDLGAPTGSIVEVEEAIAIDENDAGTNSQHPRAKGETEDVEMMDTGEDMEGKLSPKHGRTGSPLPIPSATDPGEQHTSPRRIAKGRKEVRARERQGSGDVKSNNIEKTNSRIPNGPALTSHRAHSRAEVVVPPRNGGTPIKLKSSTSHKLLASESPVSTKTTSPVKAKTFAMKSVPAIDWDEEGEPVFTKPAPPKKPQKRKRHESESEGEEERSEKPTPGPSKPKLTQRRAQESSPAPAPEDDTPVRGRRSAAQKADERLKGIMPDVINFQKEMKRGVVVSEWEKAGKERERAEKVEKERERVKENTREKVRETTKRRRSDMRYDTSESISHPTSELTILHSTKGEEEDGEDEPSTSKRTGADVHIMTTKVNVSEDTKKVQSILRSG